METTLKSYVFTFLLLLATTGIEAQVGIGTTTPSSKLEVVGAGTTSATTSLKVGNASSTILSVRNDGLIEMSSTTQGFLPPKMTRIQRNAIPSLTAGLIVWCTDCASNGELQIYNGVTWTNLIGGTAMGSRPDPPTAIVATAGTNQASVSFTAPVSNGGNSITGYTVTSSPGNVTATGASSPIVVTGLSGTSYTFTVVATNVNGNSVASLASNLVTPMECAAFTVTFTYNGSSVTYGRVLSTTGKCWLDRNLGALQVATSSTDIDAFGDLFQWGRGVDGHQLRNSATTSTLSSTDQPGNTNFILTSDSPYDWRSPQNSSLWQGVSGTNNPCPSGYRLPTEEEWLAERGSWGSNNAAGAFASPLKLPQAGYRLGNNGSISPGGEYWSSTVSGLFSREFFFGSGNASTGDLGRTYGLSVRCVKD